MGEDKLAEYFKHQSAIVDDGAEIGHDSKVWHFVHVCGEAEIGKGVSLGQNVFVGNRVVIGDRCKIQNNVSIYDNVTLEEGVFCGPSMVFTNVHNPRALVERKDEYRNTMVRRGVPRLAQIAPSSAVSLLARLHSSERGTVVTKDVQDFALMVGNPARQIGWMSAFGERLDLPLAGAGEATCPHTGDSYVLVDGRITYEPSSMEISSR